MVKYLHASFNSVNSTYSKLFLLVFLALSIRISDLNFLDGKYLWAEDGKIFLDQALSSGWHSIITPYAGYIHLFPRVIAFFAVQLDLIFLPSIFFVAWVVAILYSSVVVFDFVNKYTKSSVIAYLVPLLILLQPHTGETFFNITNAQWFLAVALAVLIIDETYIITKRNWIILIFLCLTGPFSVLLLLVMPINLFLKRDFSTNYIKYIILVLSSFVQIFFIFQSERFSGKFDGNLLDWFGGFENLLTFGSDGVGLFSYVVWGGLTFSLLMALMQNKKMTVKQINAFLFVFASSLMFFSGLLYAKQAPQELSPLGFGARYFIPTYAFLFIAIALIVQYKMRALIFFILFLIQVLLLNANPIYFSKPDSNFMSYVWLSGKADNVVIPIFPPGWNIHLKHNSGNSKIQVIDISQKSLSFINFKLEADGRFTSTNTDPQIYFSIPQKCFSSPYLGLEVLVNRQRSGIAQLFFKENGQNYSEAKSIRRWYPAGKVLMQFAFKNVTKVNSLRIDLSESKETMQLHYFKFYCEPFRN